MLNNALVDKGSTGGKSGRRGGFFGSNRQTLAHYSGMTGRKRRKVNWKMEK
jgi:hypothetical protein